jgi:hypothetical protein
MAAIVAAGASLLGSQRSRRPRPSRSCSGSAAIQSRPGWLAGSAGPATMWGVTLGKASALLPGVLVAKAGSISLNLRPLTAGVALRPSLLYGGAKQGANFAVAVRTREIYRSANGDRWLLACDSDTARVFVRHEPNLPSGGQVADIEIGAFLIAAGNGPEKQELLRLIGTLVRDPAATRS